MELDVSHIACRMDIIAQHATVRRARVAVEHGEVDGFLRFKRAERRNLAAGHDFVVDKGNVLVLGIDSLSEGRSNVFPRPRTEVEVAAVGEHAVAAERGGGL